MDGVDKKTGLVTGVVKNWTAAMTMYDYLVAIRNAMVAAAKTSQPPYGETY